MADVAKVIRVGNTLTNLIDPVTKQLVEYHKTMLWYDGTDMTDSKLDADGIYVRKGAEYFVRSLGTYDQVLQKDTMSDMRDISDKEILLLKMGYYSHIQLNGYYTAGDTPKPIDYIVSNNDTLVDDGGSIIIIGGSSAVVGSIILVHEFIEVNILYFGAVSGGADNSVVFTSIENYLDADTTRKILYFPMGNYITTSPLTIRRNVDVIMDGSLRTSSSTYGIKVGNSTGDSHVELKLNVIRSVQSNWSDLNVIGIWLVRIGQTTKTEIINANNFTVGVQIEGDSGGSCYNKFFLGHISNNKIGVKLTQRNNGWVNENLFFGGRFRRFTGTHDNVDAIGVLITSEDNTYLNQNNNNFYEPSFEYRAGAANEVMPIWIVHGQQNSFYNVRNESNMSSSNNAVIRTENDSQSNYVQLGYTDRLNHDRLFADDRGKYRSTIVDSLTNNQTEPKKQVKIYESGRLINKVISYGSNDVSSLTSELYFASSSASNLVRTINSITKTSDALVLPSSRAVAIKIDTRYIKQFCIVNTVVQGTTGRQMIRAYNAAGEMLNEATHGKQVFSLSNGEFSPVSGVFGEGWRQGSNRGNVNIFFSVGNIVHSVDVIIGGGTAGSLQLESFAVYSIHGHADLIYSNRENCIPAIPTDTSGTFPNGYFINDTSGTVMGWKKISGVWTPIPIPV